VAYPQTVRRALALINGQCPDARPCVLCDHVELADPSWQLAVEGLVGDNRFLILVDPECEERVMALLEQHGVQKTAILQGRKALADAAQLTLPENTMVHLLRFTHHLAESYFKARYGTVRLLTGEDDVAMVPRGLKQNGLTCLHYRVFMAAVTEGDLVFGAQARRRALTAKQREMRELEAQGESERTQLHIHGTLHNAVRQGKDRLEAFNRKLRNHYFGEEYYQFEYQWIPEFREYYKFFEEAALINPETEQSLFGSTVLSPESQKIFDAICAKLLDDDIERSVKDLRRIADYRNYRTYDIKKCLPVRAISLKTYGAGSGGKMETPSYVIRSAGLASALHFGEGSSHMRTVMIDESFSKMDETRCKAVLDYLSGTMGLQVIFAVPTKSAGALHDHVDQVLQVTKFAQETPRGELNTGVMVTPTLLRRNTVAELWQRQRVAIENRAHRRIIFRLEHEDNLRLRLNRPEPAEAGTWWAALDKWGHAFQRADLVAKPVLMLPGKSPEEILSRLAVIPELVRERPMSAYQISARLFWGHSKVLKGREQWLRDLLGLPREAVVDRMLPVEVTFPLGTPAGILIIENLDSYFSACNGNWQDCPDMIKIYTQGFRGAADRIRDPSCVRLHFADQPLPEGYHLADFRKAWFQEASFTGPVYFCGDLDWSGLAIFRALKAVFPDLAPWKPGYVRMLRAAEQGCCHNLEMADKTGQQPLDTSGDLWLDNYVLSFLKANQSFVDQEILG